MSGLNFYCILCYCVFIQAGVDEIIDFRLGPAVETLRKLA